VPAADTKILPEPEPRTVGEGFFMPSVRSKDIACVEEPDTGHFDERFRIVKPDGVIRWFGCTAFRAGIETAKSPA